MDKLLLLMVALATLPAAADTIAVINGRIETVGPAGTLATGTVVIVDGRIAAVGSDVRPPAGARIIDATGKIVTPGFIAASTSLTIAQVDGVRSTRDDRPGSLLGAGNDLQYGVNTASTIIAEARRTGVTRVVATPTPPEGGEAADEETAGADTAGPAGGGALPRLFGGQAAAVRLGAGDPDPVFAPRVGITLEFGEAGAAATGSRGAAYVLAHEALEDARRYAKHRAAFDTQEIPSRYGRADLEALQPVLGGTVPLLVRAHRAADLRQVLRFAKREGVRVVIEGAEEGWLVADELARTKTPVIIDSESDLPSSFEALGSRLDNAARLQAAGVLVAIVGSRDFSNLRQARFNAGTAVANGLPYAAALASITMNPALAWGIADRVGSLQPGRDADVVVWDGDPLETSSYPVVVIVRGEVQPNGTRGTELRDRYLPQDSGAHGAR